MIELLYLVGGGGGFWGGVGGGGNKVRGRKKKLRFDPFPRSLSRGLGQSGDENLRATATQKKEELRVQLGAHPLYVSYRGEDGAWSALKQK